MVISLLLSVGGYILLLLAQIVISYFTCFALQNVWVVTDNVVTLQHLQKFLLIIIG